MRERMIADPVAFGDCATNYRSAFGVTGLAAHHEECCLDLVTSQAIEHRWRDLRLRPVVERQSDF